MIFCRKCGRYYPDQTPSCIVCKADLATFGHVTHQGASMQAEPARAAVRSAPVAAPIKAVPVAAAVRTTAVGAAVRMAPAADTAVGVLEPESDNDNTDPVFDRDRFLLRQKALAIKEKYYVTDDQGNPLMFVERPALLTQQILMLGAVGS